MQWQRPVQLRLYGPVQLRLLAAMSHGAPEAALERALKPFICVYIILAPAPAGSHRCGMWLWKCMCVCVQPACMPLLKGCCSSRQALEFHLHYFEGTLQPARVGGQQWHVTES
jgi:hypothetical protein